MLTLDFEDRGGAKPERAMRVCMRDGMWALLACSIVSHRHQRSQNVENVVRQTTWGQAPSAVRSSAARQFLLGAESGAVVRRSAQDRFPHIAGGDSCLRRGARRPH